MKIAFGTDERCATTDAVRRYLHDLGHTVVDCGDGAPWPDVGRAVGEAVAHRSADLGVVCCHTGTGVSIAANKVVGVRAALCTDAATAAGARRWNDANVLAFGLRSTTETIARELIDAFVTTAVDESERATIARLP